MTKRVQNFETSATGQNAFDAATGTGTQSSSPAPAASVGGSSYGICTAAAGTVGFNRWTLDAVGPWQFRRLIYLGAGTGTNGAVNADLDIWRSLNTPASSLVTSALIRVTSGGLLNLRQSDGTSAILSSAAVPTGDWYRLEGYGNSVNNTGRVALFPLGSSTATIDLNPSTWTQGSAGLNQIQLGKTGTGTNYAGLVAFDLEEFYTGADATSAFLGPYVGTTTPLTVTASLDTASANTGVQRTLTVLCANGNGNPITLGPVNWGDGLANDAAVTLAAGVTSKTFTRTPTTTGTGKAGSVPWSQPT